MSGNTKYRTFCLKRNVQEGSTQQQLLNYVQRTLSIEDNLSLAVRLPPSQADPQEWILLHGRTFLQEIQLFVETIHELCTPLECPVMNAGEKYEYHWCDGISFPKPVRMPAIHYMEVLIGWAHSILYPITNTLASLAVLKSVFKRLFRVYAHLYYAHFDEIIQLEMEAHFNTSFQHFMYFTYEFSLIEPVELAPLAQLIRRLCPECSQ